MSRACTRIVLSILCLTALAGYPAAAQTPAAITGGVTARASGQPVAGATVAVEGTPLTATTSAVGRFRIDNVNAGPVVLVVKAPGFLDLRVPNLQATASGLQVNIELEVTPNFLDRVQVTATKQPLSIGDVAAQTDIVDRATIESRGDQTLTQAIAHVPGAVVSTQLGVFESVMLRGLPRGDPEFTNTLLLIDGVPQTTSSNGSRVVGLTINDASSIEIVRGPNSALYGRTAIGGSVNVRTADPTPAAAIRRSTSPAASSACAEGRGEVCPVRSSSGAATTSRSARNAIRGYYNTKTGGDFVDGNTAFFGKLTFAPDAKSFGSVSFNRVVLGQQHADQRADHRRAVPARHRPAFRSAHQLQHSRAQLPPGREAGSPSTTRASCRRGPSMVEVFGYRTVEQQFIDDGDFIGSPFDLGAHTVEQYPFSQDSRKTSSTRNCGSS